ncbi:MAG: hypothetical protein IKV25_06920 [Clostridia bacterium]|nr:hypothetical protein [Clostridia bacterium]
MKESIIKQYTESLPIKKQALAFSKINEYCDLLKKRGLDDDKACAEIAVDVVKNGYNVKKIRAEVYDKVNYMCRCYMDINARFRLDYDFIPDINAIKTVLISLFEHSPILHSKFVDNHIAPYWKVCDYDLNDIFAVTETDYLEKDVYDFFVQTIKVTNNVQLKFNLFVKDGKCALCVLWNHMVMDGGGIKQLLGDVFKGYNEYVASAKIPLDFRVGSRKLGEVYKDLPEETKKAAKTKFANKTSKEKKTLPFTAPCADDHNILVTKVIPAETFMGAVKKAKGFGATANDVLSTCYIDAAYKMLGCHNEDFTLSCAVDLRRYMNDPNRIGYANHTTFMPCTVSKKGETILDTLKEVSECNNKSKEDEFLGLYGLPLLNYAFTQLIYIQAELMVKMFYNNANLSVSNVGRLDANFCALDGNPPTFAMGAGAAKKKNCAVATALSLNGNAIITICIQGTEKDKEMLDTFFNHMEDSMKEIANS